jgi:hypothetical protein
VGETEVIGVLPGLFQSNPLTVLDGESNAIVFVWDQCGWIVWFRNKKMYHHRAARARGPTVEDVGYFETYYERR